MLEKNDVVGWPFNVTQRQAYTRQPAGPLTFWATIKNRGIWPTGASNPSVNQERGEEDDEGEDDARRVEERCARDGEEDIERAKPPGTGRM